MAHKKTPSCRDYFVPSNAGHLPEDTERELLICRIMSSEKCSLDQARKIFFERSLCTSRDKQH